MEGRPTKVSSWILVSGTSGTPRQGTPNTLGYCYAIDANQEQNFVKLSFNVRNMKALKVVRHLLLEVIELI